jgi:hypothetical protein
MDLNTCLSNNILIVILLIAILSITYVKLYKKERKLNILHIGKTAGRAINDSIKNEPNIKLARHQIQGRDLKNCDCDIAAVIRDPVDRLVSAIYWFKQKGEKGEMVKHPCHQFVKDKSIKEILSNPRLFEQKCLVRKNAAFIPTANFIKGIEDTVIPICYNKLQEDYDKKIKPYKKNNLDLKVRNKSARPSLDKLSKEDLDALNKYVNFRYKLDKKIYEEKCL